MFDIGKFGSTFRDGKLNGFDVMVMESAERADEIIKQIKQDIDYMINHNLLIGDNISIDYDNTDILDIDKNRIEREIKKYYASKGIYLN